MKHGKNFKNNKIFVMILSVIFVGILFFKMDNVYAATTIQSYSFSGSAAAFGGRFQVLDYLEGMSADYVKVNIKATNGDNYDLRFIYTKDYASNRKILASKTGITAKGSNNTFYFIPKNGSCPGSSSKCITVPVVDKVSTSNSAVDSYDVLYGIEVYNGSVLGGTLNVSGTYYFMNY